MVGLNFRDFIVYRNTPTAKEGPAAYHKARTQLALRVLHDQNFPNDNHFSSASDFERYITDTPLYRRDLSPRAWQNMLRVAVRTWDEYLDWLLITNSDLNRLLYNHDFLLQIFADRGRA